MTTPSPGRARTRWANARAIAALLFGPAIVWVAVAGIGILAAARPHAPTDRGAADSVGSGQCARCHAEQHRTWHASYHRTMTQRAEPGALLAPFAGETLTTLGYVATMSGGARGQPHVRIESSTDGAVLLDVDVELTVGSHRYQQYVARIDRGGGPLDRFRLPLAWHVQAQRWIHLSGAFLTPDGEAGNAADYLRHLSRWSDNCIFCHNTEPSPGLDEAGMWQPQIAELGIACESCHGNASEHIARHGDPIARVLTAWAGRPADDTITHPERLDPQRHADVCGRCHGQRIATDIARALREGDGFVPGELLSAVSRPIVRDAELSGMGPRPFADRFWPDGTPRLSAYEYQGLLLSPCYDRGRGMSCNTCHTMHGEDPDGQLRPEYSATAVCSECHRTQTLSDAASHGGHGAGIDCGDCHMPRITYGLLQGMMSHRIGTPDPGALIGRHDQPDACTQCHVDRSRAWAASAMVDLGLQGTAPGEPATREAWASRVMLDLLGGDPVQRTLACDALGQPKATLPVAERMAWLLGGLADEYPAVRFMAWRQLSALASDPELQQWLSGYDFMGPLAERIAVEGQLRARLGDPPRLSPEQREALRADRDDKAIWIGE